MKRLAIVSALMALLAVGQGLHAGAVGGRKIRTTRVAAESTDVFRIMFRANEPAIVTVEGDGDTDLDLYVYDSLGNVVSADDDITDRCVGVWVPRWTGYFTVRVVNLGSVYNEYTIETN